MLLSIVITKSPLHSSTARYGTHKAVRAQARTMLSVLMTLKQMSSFLFCLCVCWLTMRYLVFHPRFRLMAANKDSLSQIYTAASCIRCPETTPTYSLKLSSL